MKFRAASILSILLALAPAVYAQRSRTDDNRSSRDDSGQRSEQRSERRSESQPEPRPEPRPTPRVPFVNVPSSPILPMTNPVAPMRNPVAPITNPVMPIVRYGPTPTVVVPTTPSKDSRDDRRDDDRRRSNRDFPVVVLGGVYYTQDPVYYYPQPAPVTPGQLPNVSNGFEPPPVNPGAPPASYATVPYSSVREETEYFPEPHVIITAPTPPLTVTPPAIGTLKAEVLARYGEPWGSVRAGGQETLYFNGGLVVVFVDGRVAQIKQ